MQGADLNPTTVFLLAKTTATLKDQCSFPHPSLQNLYILTGKEYNSGSWLQRKGSLVCGPGDQGAIDFAYYLYTYFPCCCDQIPDKQQLEGLILPHI